MSKNHVKAAPKRTVLTVAIVLWLLLCGLGLGLLARHSAIAGEAATSRTSWPARSGLEPPSQIPTLLLFLHPHCPCSSATMSELERATAGVQNRYRIVVVVYTPESSPEGWDATPLCERARALAHSTIVTDAGGREAALFGATTSGHAMLFAPNGERVFEGGLTPSRAHEGDNDGRSTLRSLLSGGASVVRSTPVYGCPLGRPKNGACELCAESERAP